MVLSEVIVVAIEGCSVVVVLVVPADEDAADSEVVSRGIYVVDGFSSVTGEAEDGIAVVVVVEDISIVGGGLDVTTGLVAVGELGDTGTLNCIAGDEVVSRVSKLVKFVGTLGSRTHPSGVVIGTQSVD